MSKTTWQLHSKCLRLIVKSPAPLTVMLCTSHQRAWPVYPMQLVFLLAEQKGIPRQHTITDFMKMHTRRMFFADLSPDNKHRLNQVSLSQVPACHASSDIAPPRHHAHDTLRQVPMALWALTCYYMLSDQAVLVSLAISLGTPIPHARYKEHVTN
jgi:hypothetical protein